MGLHVYPVSIQSVHPPIRCLWSRPSPEFRTGPTVIYFHGLNSNRNQIFQETYLPLAEAIQALHYNLFAVELRHHGERRANKESTAVQNWLTEFAKNASNPFADTLTDLHAIVDFLLEKKIATPDRIAVTGLSWGAMHALYALTAEPRIHTGVALLPVCQIRSLIELKPLAHHPLLQQYEPLHYVKGLAPKPLLFVTAQNDTRAQPQHALALYRQLQTEYQQIGAETHLAYSMILGATHAYHPQLTERTTYWLRQHLEK